MCIDDWIIQWKSHKYHQWWQLVDLWVTVLLIKETVITRICLFPTLISPCYAFVATTNTLWTWNDEYNMSFWPSTKKITCTQHHHKIILHSSWHVQRVLVVSTEVEQGRISCYHQLYLCLLHLMIQSLICLRCPGFVNSHPDLHRTLLVIAGGLIARTVTQRAMGCHHQWYLCLLHWLIQSLIQLSCPRFVNSHPALHITQRISCKLLKYPVGLHLIRQIPCHRRPPIMEVAIFINAWLMCLSLRRNIYKCMVDVY